MSIYEKKIWNKTDYEPGMTIGYDDNTHLTVINFRGICFETLDVLNNKSEMVKVAEDYCRGKGWAG